MTSCALGKNQGSGSQRIRFSACDALISVQPLEDVHSFRTVVVTPELVIVRPDERSANRNIGAVRFFSRTADVDADDVRLSPTELNANVFAPKELIDVAAGRFDIHRRSAGLGLFADAQEAAAGASVGCTGHESLSGPN